MRRRRFVLGLGLLAAGGLGGGAWLQRDRPKASGLAAALDSWGQSMRSLGSAAQARDGDDSKRCPIPLPADMAAGALSLEEAVDRRRSIRDYSDQPLKLEELSRLLHAAGGITEPSHGLRAAPSAGALYPLELYVVANRVEQLDRGIYHYQPQGHSLDLVSSGDFHRPVGAAALGQQVVTNAAAVLVVTAVVERTRQKYGDRAERYVLMEAGHVGQNVYLAATALGLGACAVGAFFDADLGQLLQLDSAREVGLYLLPVGRPR